MIGKVHGVDKVDVETQHLKRENRRFISDIPANHVTLNAQYTASLFVHRHNVPTVFVCAGTKNCELVQMVAFNRVGIFVLHVSDSILYECRHKLKCIVVVSQLYNLFKS